MGRPSGNVATRASAWGKGASCRWASATALGAPSSASSRSQRGASAAASTPVPAPRSQASAKGPSPHAASVRSRLSQLIGVGQRAPRIGVGAVEILEGLGHRRSSSASRPVAREDRLQPVLQQEEAQVARGAVQRCGGGRGREPVARSASSRIARAASAIATRVRVAVRAASTVLGAWASALAASSARGRCRAARPAVARRPAPRARVFGRAARWRNASCTAESAAPAQVAAVRTASRANHGCWLSAPGGPSSASTGARWKMTRWLAEECMPAAAEPPAVDLDGVGHCEVDPRGRRWSGAGRVGDQHQRAVQPAGARAESLMPRRSCRRPGARACPRRASGSAPQTPARSWPAAIAVSSRWRSAAGRLDAQALDRVEVAVEDAGDARVGARDLAQQRQLVGEARAGRPGGDAGGPARSSAPNASSGKRPAVSRSRSAAPAATSASASGRLSRSRSGPAVLTPGPPALARGRAARATSGAMSATVSSQPSRVAPGPSPSWARTIAPSRRYGFDRGEHRVGHVAAPVVRVGAPADDVQPARGGRAGPSASTPHGVRQSSAAREAPARPAHGRDPRPPARVELGVAVCSCAWTPIAWPSASARDQLGVRGGAGAEDEEGGAGAGGRSASSTAGVHRGSGPSSKVRLSVPIRLLPPRQEPAGKPPSSSRSRAENASSGGSGNRTPSGGGPHRREASHPPRAGAVRPGTIGSLPLPCTAPPTCPDASIPKRRSDTLTGSTPPPVLSAAIPTSPKTWSRTPTPPLFSRPRWLSGSDELGAPAPRPAQPLARRAAHPVLFFLSRSRSTTAAAGPSAPRRPRRTAARWTAAPCSTDAVQHQLPEPGPWDQGAPDPRARPPLMPRAARFWARQPAPL